MTFLPKIGWCFLVFAHQIQIPVSALLIRYLFKEVLRRILLYLFVLNPIETFEKHVRRDQRKQRIVVVDLFTFEFHIDGGVCLDILGNVVVFGARMFRRPLSFSYGSLSFEILIGYSELQSYLRAI